MRRLLSSISMHVIIFVIALVAARAWLTIRTLNLPPAGPTPSLASTPRLEPRPTESPGGPEHLTPYEICSFFETNPQVDLTRLWKKLRIKTINASEYQQLDPKEFPFFNRCGNCQAETFEYDLDNEIGDEVVVKIQDYEACRYLIYKEVEGPEVGWKLLGHIDSTFNKYRASRHLVLLSGGRSWLVITGQGASGSGVALYISRLFLVSPNGLREIFVFTSDGSQYGYGDNPARDFHATVVSCDIHDGTATAEIDFAVRYSVRHSDLNPEMVFAKRQKAVLVRRLPRGKQRLDATRSELSEHELGDVYNIDSLNYEAFLKYNYQELSHIASGKEDARRAWLRRFLASCEDPPEEWRLRSILKRG